MNKFTPSKQTKMVTNTDEFSFPVMSNPLASCMQSSTSSSSSLWRISSRVYHHHEEEYEDDEGEEEDRRLEVRSMCEAYSPKEREREIECASWHGEELDMEERMDCLWEDFNEEEKGVSVGDQQVKIPKGICVLQGTKMGRRSNGSMMIMGKLLKGLVSIRKSAQHKIMKARF